MLIYTEPWSRKPRPFQRLRATVTGERGRAYRVRSVRVNWNHSSCYSVALIRLPVVGVVHIIVPVKISMVVIFFYGRIEARDIFLCVKIDWMLSLVSYARKISLWKQNMNCNYTFMTRGANFYALFVNYWIFIKEGNISFFIGKVYLQSKFVMAS